MSFSVALLISTYNWPEALELVLQSVEAQTTLPAKVLIADDGPNENTRKVIEHFKTQINIPIEHIWHSDEGFRKCIIVNKAIATCQCDYIIQIDGDIILHPEFVADHISEAETGFYIKGSRTLIDFNKTKELIDNKTITLSVMDSGLKNKINGLHLPFFASLFRRKSQRSRDLKGCNCAFWRLDFIKVNGYNNNLMGWGHEDIELAARLINAGIMQKRIKLKAICYHLHHKINDRSCENENLSAYNKAVKEGIIESENGYKQSTQN
jgi:glycosyltransferase involved in cell wall biosynthesis